MTITIDGIEVDRADAGGARRDDGGDRPALVFDTITVSDDAAAIAGRVSERLALVADLCINGQYVPLDMQGRFFAVVRFEGYKGLSIWLDAGIHGELTLDLPLRAN
jgi:hypothetical protein